MSSAKFKKEPLKEVVFGVEFNSPEFASVHFGLYWQAIKDRFPIFPVDRPPVGGLPLVEMPALRRVWFESASKEQLIQLQESRFYYNWRRRSHDSEYPHFDKVSSLFFKEWQNFQTWKTDEEAQIPDALKYELTYLNTIDKEFGWSCVDDYPKVFSFVDETWRDVAPTKKALRIGFECNLPKESGILAVSIDQAVDSESNSPIVFLNLTARSNDASIDIKQWFELAHDSIVETFITLISAESKENWDLQWL